MTEWREILSGDYEVSRCGRIRRARPGRRTAAGREMKPVLMKIGYFMVAPTVAGRNRRFYLHELVALAFIGPRPAGREINHIDGVKTNNVASNLEYVSHAENMRHARRLGLLPSGRRARKSHLTEDDVRAMREAWAAGARGVDLSIHFGVATATVSHIVNRKTWRDVA